MKFLPTPRQLRGSHSFLNKMRYLGTYNLTDDDMKELNSMHPGFSLKQLHKWVKIGNYVDSWGRSNLIPYPYTGDQAPETSFFQQAYFEYLTKDIGDLTPIVHKERKKNFLYDDSIIITHTFFTEVNKKIQSYRLISLEYDKTIGNLINSKNRLKFNIINNIQREFMTLQLEDVLNPKKTETVD